MLDTKELLQKIPDRMKIVLIGVCVLIFLVADFKLVLIPQLGLMSQMNPKISQLKNDINSIKNDLNSFTALKNTLELSKKKASSYSKMVVTQDLVPVLLDDISKIAKASDVKLMQIKTEKDTNAKPVAKFDGVKYYSFFINLDLNASYFPFVNFLRKLENSARFFRVVSFEITPDNSNYFQHKIKMTLEAYVVYEDVK